LFNASGYSGIDASAARNRVIAASRSPPARQQCTEIVAGLGEIRFERESILERAAGLVRLAASRQQRTQTVQRGRTRVRLGRTLECGHGGTLESVVEKLAAVRQVIAAGQPEIERARKRYGASEALGRRHLDRPRVRHDLVDVHAVAIDLDDIAA
jgi:hypothetical protein